MAVRSGHPKISAIITMFRFGTFTGCSPGSYSRNFNPRASAWTLRTTIMLLSANTRAFNKVGWAYGFMTDCSYIQDTLNKVEFFISCTMYLNNDEILNDEVYE